MKSISVFVGALLVFLGGNTTYAQSSDTAAQQSPTVVSPARSSAATRVGVGVAVSTLGVAIQVGTPVTSQSNARVAFNVLSYSHNFSDQGSTYAASLRLRSVEAYFDWFPFHGGFHVSPGAMLYNGNQVNLTVSAPGGRTMTLGDATYVSNPSNPIGGTGQVAFSKVAPALRVGWGNLLPRSSRHWSVPFEIGALYQKSPVAVLSLTGSACNMGGTNCLNVATDPTLRANVLSQQGKINNDLAPFKFYPVMSIGFAYSF